MQTLELFNSKQKKHFLETLERQFDKDFQTEDLLYLSSKDRVYLMNKEFVEFDFENIKIDKVGLHIGTFSKAGFRFSIEGSQLFGKLAKKSVVELNDEDFEKWISGEDIPFTGDAGIYLVCDKKNHDFFGCGIKSSQEDFLLNHVPKARRIRTSKQI